MTQSKFVLERLGLKIPKLRNFPALPEDTGAERHKKTSPAGTVDFVESLSEYYQDIPLQRCVVHFYRNILRKVVSKSQD